MTETETAIPAVGSCWKYGERGAVYEIIEGEASPGFVLGRHRGSHGVLVGHSVELRVAGFGTTWLPVEEEA